MRKIFYELLNEAKDGNVYFENDAWPIGFNSVIVRDGTEIRNFNDKNMSTLVIKNEEKFLILLEEYIRLELSKNRKITKFYEDVDKNTIKLIMTYLFVNATTEDFLNPSDLIRRNIDFLNDNTFSDFSNFINISNNNSISIKNSSQSVLMETPNKMEFCFTDGEFTYELPSISYGISVNSIGEKKCYIYSCLNPKEKKNLSDNEIKYRKKINRLLYKVNGGVKEAEERDDYYFSLENISDVSPSAVVSLLIFMLLLKKENITEVKIVPYLPLRYLSRDLAADRVLDEDKKISLKERNDMIQTNITNKLINTIKRVAYHLEGISIDSFPYEYDEFLSISLLNSNNKVVNNEFLNEISSCVDEKCL